MILHLGSNARNSICGSSQSFPAPFTALTLLNSLHNEVP